MMQKRTVTFWLAVAATVVTAFLGVVSSVAAENLPPGLLGKPIIVWPLFVLLLLASSVIHWSKDQPELLRRVLTSLRDWVLRARDRLQQAGTAHFVRTGLGIVVVLILVSLPWWLPAEEVSPPAPCDSPVKLTILADAGMAASLSEVADTLINPEGSCRRADIHVYSAAASDAIEAVASGWQTTKLRAVGAEPAVWIPASTADLAQVQARANSPELTKLGSVAQAAVVVAMTREQRDALGLDRTAPWSEILELADPSIGSGLRILRANPTASTSALLGTTAMYQRLQEEPDAAARRHDTEQLIEPFAGTDIAALCDAGAEAASGQQAVAIITTEQAMSSRNRNKQEWCGPSHRDDPDFEAIYPSDGTYVQDYPYVLLPASGAHKQRGGLAMRLYGELLSDEGQQQLREALYRDLDGRIDEGYGALVGQPENALKPPDGETVTGVKAQWNLARKPVTTLLTVDISGSMDEPMAGQNTDRMTAARQAVRHIVQRIGAIDRVGLWEFSTQLHGPLDHREIVPIRPVDSDVGGRDQRSELLGRLDGVQAEEDGDTGLYDTMLAGMEHLRAREDSASEDDDQALNALIVVTDGLNDDPAGGASLGDVIRAHRTGPPVYVILLTFGTAACSSGELSELASRPALDCIDAGAIGIDHASKRISDTLWGTP